MIIFTVVYSVDCPNFVDIEKYLPTGWHRFEGDESRKTGVEIPWTGGHHAGLTSTLEPQDFWDFVTRFNLFMVRDDVDPWTIRISNDSDDNCLADAHIIARPDNPKLLSIENWQILKEELLRQFKNPPTPIRKKRHERVLLKQLLG